MMVGAGPVAEQGAHIAGLNILECASPDEALEAASGNQARSHPRRRRLARQPPFINVALSASTAATWAMSANVGSGSASSM